MIFKSQLSPHLTGKRNLEDITLAPKASSQVSKAEWVSMDTALLAFKRMERLRQKPTWMNLEDIVLSETRTKDTYRSHPTHSDPGERSNWFLGARGRREQGVTV